MYCLILHSINFFAGRISRQGLKWMLNHVICIAAESIEACKRNIQFNGSLASSKVETHLADARVYMLTHPK